MELNFIIHQSLSYKGCLVLEIQKRGSLQIHEEQSKNIDKNMKRMFRKCGIIMGNFERLDAILNQNQ